MSLQIWLPLIDDLHNQGLNGSATVTGGSKLTSGGKISAGHYKVYSGALLSITHSLPDTTEFSYCYWINIPSSITSVEAWQTFMAIRAKHNDTASSMNVSWASYNLMKWYDSTGFDLKLWLSFSYDIWYHIAVVHSSGNLKIYINGDLESRDYSMSEVIKLTAGTISIGSTNATNGKIGLQDFRLYNHALSIQEVKELAKGLVVHYTLGSACAEAPALRSSLSSATWNLLINPTRFGSTSANGITLSVDKNAGTVILSGTASAYTVLNFGLATNATTSGHKYLLSGCPKGGYNADTVASSGGTYDLRLNYNGTYYSDIGDGVIFNGGQNANIYCRVANGYNCLNVVFHPMLFDLTAIYGSGNEPTTANFKKAFPMTYYPYDSGTTKDLRLPIPDSSGYSNNGTITGTLTTSTDTPRYDKCILFDGVNSIIQGSLSLADDYKYTASFWYKPITISSSTLWVFAIASGNNHQFGCYVNNSNIVTNTGGVVGGSGATSFNKSLVANTLYHIVITCDGTNTKVYVDGNLLGTAAKNGTTTGNTFWVGLRPGAPGNYNLNGKLSDFRIYATALSADDVKDLYNLGASIS